MITESHETLSSSLLADPQVRAPVFIVGMNGSGTTMLLDCLNHHPWLYGFPRETRLIPHLIRVAPGYGPLENDANFRALWQYAASLAPFRLANGGEPRPLPENWRACSRDLAGLLNMLLLSFASEQGKSLWCEKSPQYAQHMRALAALFPRARFIHVIRDGRDCAYSFHRRWRRTPALTMTRWKRLVREARAQGSELPERYLEVRYEDLTGSPEAWMRRICGFLDLPFDPAVLESSQPYLKEAGDGRLKANSGRWRSYFTPVEAERLDRIGGRMLAECGYVTSQRDADYTPPAWRQNVWKSSDRTYQFLREVGMKLSGRIERPWWSILSRPINAYRQGKENWF